MDLLLDTNEAFERRRQGCWLQELYDETKKLTVLAEEAQAHYTATLTALKSLSHAYENINALLVSVSRYFSEVSAGSRIGVCTNVGKFKRLVTTVGESPQGKEMQRLLKEQVRDAEQLKVKVKHSFATLKQRDHHYSAFSTLRPSPTQRGRQTETDAKLGQEVREIYAGASRVVDKECIGFVRAWTAGASAIIQLVENHYTRSLLAATEAVGTSYGYPATGVVQHRTVRPVTQPTAPRAPQEQRQTSGYGLNDADYVSQPNSDVPVALQPPSRMLLHVNRHTDAGVALEFGE